MEGVTDTLNLMSESIRPGLKLKEKRETLRKRCKRER